jgi:hypothetical protein
LPRKDDLEELAVNVSAAFAKARQLNLPTSAYILSVVMLDVSQAIRSTEANDKDGAAP